MEQTEGITKAFLESTLNFPLEKYKVYSGSNLGDGFTCTLFSVDIWEPAHQESPRRILLKVFPSNPSRREFLDVRGTFKTELGVYSTVLPRLQQFQDENLPEEKRLRLPFPRLVSGKYIEVKDRQNSGRPLSQLDNHIILPDLRSASNGSYRLRDKFLGLDLDHYRLVVESQAILHGISWAYKCRNKLNSLKEHFDCLDPDVISGINMFLPILEKNANVFEEQLEAAPRIQEGIQHLKSVLPSAALLYLADQEDRTHTKDSLLRTPGTPSDNEEPWRVLLHGDCWINNMLFRYDPQTSRPVQVLFIDLQVSREGNPLTDLTYALFANAAPDLRKKHLSSMLHLYFDTFSDICRLFSVPALPGWSWDEFNRRFRRASVVGGIFALGLPVFLKNAEELEDLDEAAAGVNVENKEQEQVPNNNSEAEPVESSSNALDKMGKFFSHVSRSNNFHPAVLPRFVAIIEDLIEYGVL